MSIYVYSARTKPLWTPYILQPGNICNAAFFGPYCMILAIWCREIRCTAFKIQNMLFSKAPLAFPSGYSNVQHVWYFLWCRTFHCCNVGNVAIRLYRSNNAIMTKSSILRVDLGRHYPQMQGSKFGKSKVQSWCGYLRLQVYISLLI